MTATTTPDAPAAEEPSVLTTTVEVPGLGVIGEDQLPELTRDLLKQVIRALKSAPPRGANRDELELYARNGLRLKALVDHGAPLRAIEAAPSEPEMTTEEIAEGILAADGLTRPLVAPPSVFQQILAISEVMSKSNLVPAPLRGTANLPSLRIVLLRAWDLGITQSAALESLYVVNDKIGMEGKLMAALVRRAGHSLVVAESDGFHAAWTGTRADNGDTMVAQFDLDDAQNAGLISGYDATTFAVRPLSDKKVWANYPKAMLKWRALAILCRELFSDCLAGVSYLPEELGYIDTEALDTVEGPRGGIAGEPERTVTLNQQRSILAARIAELDEDLRAELRETWKKHGLPKPDDLRPAALGTATRLIDEAEAKMTQRHGTDDVDDAEMGDESAPDGAPLPDETADDDPDLTEYCEGCGEAIGDDDDPVYDDQEKPWHIACSPMFGGGSK